jgi:hypothetical protein
MAGIKNMEARQRQEGLCLPVQNTLNLNTRTLYRRVSVTMHLPVPNRMVRNIMSNY